MMDPLGKFLSILEYYKKLLSDPQCRRFFYKRREELAESNDVSSTSFLILNHSKIECDEYRKTHLARHSMARGMGNVERIPEENFRVLKDFKSTDAEELSLTADEIVSVIQKSDTGWWLAQSVDDAERIGWVPASYLKCS